MLIEISYGINKTLPNEFALYQSAALKNEYYTII